MEIVLYHRICLSVKKNYLTCQYMIIYRITNVYPDIETKFVAISNNKNPSPEKTTYI
jgi:hypothetical protein